MSFSNDPLATAFVAILVIAALALAFAILNDMQKAEEWIPVIIDGQPVDVPPPQPDYAQPDFDSTPPVPVDKMKKPSFNRTPPTAWKKNLSSANHSLPPTEWFPLPPE